MKWICIIVLKCFIIVCTEGITAYAEDTVYYIRPKVIFENYKPYIEAQNKLYEAFKNETDQKLIDEKQKELIAPIIDTINLAITRLGKSKGITYILDAEQGVLFADDRWDKTNELLGILNNTEAPQLDYSILKPVPNQNFQPKNVSWIDRNTCYEIIGELKNLSGKNYDVSSFKLNLYNKEVLTGVLDVIIYNFNNNQSKSFSVLTDGKPVFNNYKIQFENGIEY